jgi:hypothetical protein
MKYLAGWPFTPLLSRFAERIVARGWGGLPGFCLLCFAERIENKAGRVKPP